MIYGPAQRTLGNQRRSRVPLLFLAGVKDGRCEIRPRPQIRADAPGDVTGSVKTDGLRWLRAVKAVRREKQADDFRSGAAVSGFRRAACDLRRVGGARGGHARRARSALSAVRTARRPATCDRAGDAGGYAAAKDEASAACRRGCDRLRGGACASRRVRGRRAPTRSELRHLNV